MLKKKETIVMKDEWMNKWMNGEEEFPVLKEAKEKGTLLQWVVLD